MEATRWLPPAARVGFGLMWAVDATLKWSPAFTGHLLGYFSTGGQPGWVVAYVGWWTRLLGHDPRAVAYGLAAAESLVALGLLVGVGKRTVCLGGAVLSLLIWSTAEGFGGPYMPGSTDVGTSIAYVLVFALLWNPAAWPVGRLARPSRRTAAAAVWVAAVAGLLVTTTAIASTGSGAPDSGSMPGMSHGGQMDMSPGGQDDH
jgi:thiosulfate dehydrogenase [quinone] large subunit